jgi:hypothetical protein
MLPTWELGRAASWMPCVRFPAQARHFPVLSLHSGCGAEAASYPVHAADSFPRDKAGGA